MKHQKHAALAKPALGHWARTEWALSGTTCDNIRALAAALGRELSGRMKIAYIDADHGAAEPKNDGFSLEWTDKIGFERLDFAKAANPWERRALLNDLNLALVNGNHFEASRQIVALDRRKFDSLARKLERLTQVDLFLTKNGDPNFGSPAELPGFLKDHLPGWEKIPVLDWAQPRQIAAFLENNTRIAPLKALILTGGKSVRMGQDKAEIAYHGRPQWQHLRDLLQQNGLETFISCRAEQADSFAGAPVIADTFTDLGPMGAILSAFRYDPDSAWLVLACDLPLFDAMTLAFLRDYRAHQAAATAFQQRDQPDFPEPLAAIWEPKIYARLLAFLAQGVSCPRKVLINSDTRLIAAAGPALLNANTPADRDAILKEYFS